MISWASRIASATTAPRAGPTTASPDPWITSVGHGTRAPQAECLFAVVRPIRVHTRRTIVCGSVLEAPPDRVLDLLGRVALGERLREEELENPPPIVKPVMTVPFRPAVQCHRLVIERVRAFRVRRVGGYQQVRCDQHQSRDPVRVLRGEQSVLPRRCTTTRGPRTRRRRDPAPPTHLPRSHAGRTRARRADDPNARCPGSRTSPPCHGARGRESETSTLWSATISHVGSSNTTGSPSP